MQSINLFATSGSKVTARAELHDVSQHSGAYVSLHIFANNATGDRAALFLPPECFGVAQQMADTINGLARTDRAARAEVSA